MSDRIDLNTFPSTRTEALTMLFLQNQDLSGVSPEELTDKYLDTYNRVKEQLTLRKNTKSLR